MTPAEQARLWALVEQFDESTGADQDAAGDVIWAALSGWRPGASPEDMSGDEARLWEAMHRRAFGQPGPERGAKVQ